MLPKLIRPRNLSSRHGFGQFRGRRISSVFGRRDLDDIINVSGRRNTGLTSCGACKALTTLFVSPFPAGAKSFSNSGMSFRMVTPAGCSSLNAGCGRWYGAEHDDFLNDKWPRRSWTGTKQLIAQVVEIAQTSRMAAVRGHAFINKAIAGAE